MNEKDKQRVQQATGQQSEPPKQQTVSENSGELNGAKIRSMLRKKAIAAQAVDDANYDAEFYVEAYNSALERAIGLLTIGNIEANQAVNNAANQEVNQDFFQPKQSTEGGNEPIKQSSDCTFEFKVSIRFKLNKLDVPQSNSCDNFYQQIGVF